MNYYKAKLAKLGIVSFELVKRAKLLSADQLRHTAFFLNFLSIRRAKLVTPGARFSKVLITFLKFC